MAATKKGKIFFVGFLEKLNFLKNFGVVSILYKIPKTLSVCCIFK